MGAEVLSIPAVNAYLDFRRCVRKADPRRFKEICQTDMSRKRTKELTVLEPL